MSAETILLADKFKSAPTVKSTSGLQIMCVNSIGNLYQFPLSSVMVDHGDITDLNEAKELGIYRPASKTALNLPNITSINTSDTILNVGNTPNYFEQLYIPLLNKKFVLKRSYGGINGWSEWLKMTVETLE